MLAALGTLPTDDAAWAYEFKWDGIRAIGARRWGPHPAHIAQRQRPERVRFPRTPRPRRALRIPPGRDRRRDRGLRRPGPSPVPEAAATHPRRRRNPRRPAWRPSSLCVYVIFDLLYLDGAVTHHRSLHRAAASTRGPSGSRRTDNRIVDAQPPLRWPRFRHLEREQGAGSRGGPGQATRFALPSRQAVADVDQGQEHPHPGSRHRRLDTGRGTSSRPFRLSAARHPHRDRSRVRGPGGNGLHRGGSRRLDGYTRGAAVRRRTPSPPRSRVSTARWPPGSNRRWSVR